MPSPMVSPHQVWETFIDREHGDVLRNALLLLTIVPEAKLRQAVHKISTAETLGPLVDPSRWRGAQTWQDATRWKELFAAAAALRRLLPSEEELLAEARAASVDREDGR